MLVAASIRPAPRSDLLAALSHSRVALTVEAHSVDGGLGSLVAEIIAEHGLKCRLVRCGVRSAPAGTTGGNSYHNAAHGISREALVDQALSALRAA